MIAVVKNPHKVAVIMSVYKGDALPYVILSVNSILNQTYTNLVFVIQVDGPVHPNVLDYLFDISKSDNRIVLIVSQANLGLAARLNQSIDYIEERGDISFIARMDADDISQSYRIEKQVNFLLANNDIDVVGSDVQEIDDKGAYLFYKRMPCSHEEIYRKFITKCPFNPTFRS